LIQDHLFKRVHVESHNATFEGVLLAFDNHFNILLKDAEQIRTIVKTVKDEEGGEKKTETVFERRSLGVIEIRGMWVTSITVIGEGEAKDRKEKAMAKIKGSVGGSGSGGLGGDSAGGGLAAMAEQYEAGRSQRRGEVNGNNVLFDSMLIRCLF
jgi:small nuclear ribonucleoprotein (snRNP)-like protein